MRKGKDIFPGLIIKTISLERYGENICLLVLPPLGIHQSLWGGVGYK